MLRSIHSRHSRRKTVVGQTESLRSFQHITKPYSLSNPAFRSEGLRTQRHTAVVFMPRSLSSLPLLFPYTGTKNIWPTDPFALRQHTLDIVQLLLAFYIMFTIYLFHSTYDSFFHFIFISFRFSAFKILAGRCHSMARFNFALFGCEYCCFHFNLRVLRMDLNCCV